MTLSQNEIAAARAVYETYWDSYLTGNIEAFAATIDETFSIIGTSEGEKSFGKEAVAAMYEAQFDEIVGKAQVRNRQVREIPTGDMLQIIEFSDIYVLIDSDWSFYSKFRLSTLLHETSDGWKLLQQHGSLPDMRVGEGETVAVEKISKENLELRDAVKRRTIELENKSRELEIEAALERVRSRSMAMQNSDELKAVIKVVYEQLSNLNINLDHAGFVVDYSPHDDWHFWIADDREIPSKITHPYFESVWANQFDEAKKNGENLFVTRLNFEEKNKFYNELLSHVSGLTETSKEFYLSCPGLAATTVLFDDVSLYIENFSGIPYKEEENEIVLRFGKVFQQAYTRFLDLQKAEAQAREAKVETALEKVRSRTMAMQHSDELQEASYLLDQQVRSLGIQTWGCAFNIYGEEDSTEWFGNEAGVLHTYTVPRKGIFKEYYEKGQRGESIIINEFSGKACVDHYEYMSKLPVLGDVLKILKETNDGFPTYQIDHVVYFKYGYLLFITREDVPEAHGIFKRFAKVFEQTYTRFLDLQKAEAQAREAQIENALEKVRSRSLAMQKSDELLAVIIELSAQLQQLNVRFDFVSFGVIGPEKEIDFWMAGEGYTQPELYHMPYFDHFVTNSLLEDQKKGLRFSESTFNQKDTREWMGVLYENNPHSKMLADTKDHTLTGPGMVRASVILKNICVFMGNFRLKPHSKEQNALLIRFANAFDQAYTRFLDLQKAETQAREAKIETALEKVRSRTMGMQKSDELADVADVLFKEMNNLVHNLWTCGFVLCEKDREEDEWWLGLEEGFTRGFFLPNVNDYAHAHLYEGWLKKDDFRTVQLEGDDLQAHYEWLMEIPVAKNIFDEMEAAGMERPEWQKLHAAYFSKGYLVIITREPCPEEAIFKRFAQVFDLTYTRFLDLQKAEAQAREAQIENALEKVRSRSLAMHKSDELNEVVAVLFEKLKQLGIPFTAVGVATGIKGSKDLNAFVCGQNDDGLVITNYRLPYFNNPIPKDLYGALDKKLDFFIGHYSKEEKDAFYENVIENTPEFRQLPKDIKDMIFGSKTYTISMVAVKNAVFNVNDFEGGELTDSQVDILKRFARVFDQAYTRFLDLQKSEEQAREAQIANALEKVRSRSLAMQGPDELAEVARLLREEMGALGVEELETSSIYLHDKSSGKTQCWFTIKDAENPEKSVSDRMTMDLAETAVGRQMSAFYRSAQEKASILMKGDERGEWIRYCEDKSDLFGTSEFYGESIPERTYHLYKFSSGFIGAASPGDISEESWDLMRRATSVFSFAYTRFLDLQKAEMQAREAQIELSLERIRARVTGMQESSDLLDIVVTMRTEFVNLGHEAHYFWHMRWLPDTYKKAMTSGDGTKIGMVMTLPRHIHGDIQAVAAWEKTKDPIHVLAMDVDLAVDYVDKMITLGDFERVDPQAPSLDDIRHIGGLTFVMARTTHGEIGFSLPGVVPDPPKDAVDTLVRFAGVFDLAYRRFEDLKKAEAQARENRIELALERTRNQSMLMQHSDEIKGISDVFHQQLLELNIPTEFSYVWLPDESKNNHQFWASWAENKKGKLTFSSKQVTYPLDKTEPYTAACYKAWEDQENVHIEFIKPDEISDFFSTWAELLDGAKNLKARNFSEGIYYAEAYMRYGCFGINIRRELTEQEKQVLKRFSIEFERAYTRFLDLQKAEKQAQEAQVELSLERIRAQVTSMKESTDLFDIVVGMRKEFISLGHESDYFWHMRWLPEVYEMSMTSEDGNRLGMVIQVPKVVHDQIDALAEWEKSDDPIFVLPLNAKDSWDYLENMNTYGHYEKADPNAPAREDIEHIGGLTFIIARTTHGEIGYSLPGMVPNPPEEALDTLMRFATVFDLAYKRFEDLKTAEKDLIEIKRARQKAEDALIELKATQTQLIQQEKLASLGQLTAGIAHEIKNPLNFVNNFSEVSVELIDEALEEIEKLEHSDVKEEIVEILNDVKGNLVKVHTHGTRADSIVKSMLQHSRGGSGKMESTDLNALIKEYVNLSFHGMRAGKNPINVDIQLHLDEEIGKVNLIGEDFSRVLLNICNNAFDAMREKAKTETDYLPILFVKTQRTANDELRIAISDNGPGIPDDIKDKILQPFFTTKKGTDGTGLGLSITNDIIKAHGGEITIDSGQDKGTTFSIHIPTNGL